MEEECEPETEGVINIPKVMKLSSISLIDKKLRLKGYKKKSIAPQIYLHYFCMMTILMIVVN